MSSKPRVGSSSLSGRASFFVAPSSRPVERQEVKLVLGLLHKTGLSKLSCNSGVWAETDCWVGQETKDIRMRLLIALILPWLTFFTIGRPLAGIVCLILQITLIGWLPATIWAVYALSQFKTDQKIERALQRNRT